MPRLRTHLAPLALFCFLTLLLAFPIVAGLGRAVPGWEGDNLYYVRSMWWLKHALFDLRISPFYDPLSFYPVGEHIARSEMTPANTVPGLPITLLWSPEAAYSIVVLFSFVATAMGTYFWVRHLTGSRMAGVVAGTIAAFLPMRFAHLPGHLPQITTQWVPWTLFALERFLDRRTLGRGAAFGVFAALVVLGSWYNGYALMLMLPVYAVLRTWRRRAVWREAAWWRGIAVGAAIALVLVLPFLLEMLKLSGAGELKRSIIEMDSWSLNPYDFFIPTLLHPVWGDAVSAWFPVQRRLSVERQVSLGYAALILAVIGFVRLRANRPTATTLIGVWLASYVIALGPTLHWNDEQVRFWVPRIVVSPIVRTLQLIGGPEATHPMRSEIASTQFTPVMLPSLFLYYLVPLTSSMRVMGRFGLWTGLATAAVAGFGALTLAERATRFGRRAPAIMTLVLAGAIALESWSAIPMVRVAPRAVDRWLATEPPPCVVVELPVDQAVRAFQNYWATVHRCAMVFGWNGASFPPADYNERVAALAAFPSRESVAFLRSTGVTHVLVTSAAVSDWIGLRARIVQAGLQWDRAIDEVHVFRVPAASMPGRVTGIRPGS